MTTQRILDRLDALENAIEGTGRPIIVEMLPGETDEQAIERAGARGQTAILIERTTTTPGTPA